MNAKTPFKKDGMFAGASNIIFENAKNLRKSMTYAETVLWFHLKQKPDSYKFRRQHPLGVYIADFYCHKCKLVIEVDGSIHNNEEIIHNDSIRQKFIEESGIKVIRFTNKEVLENVHLVLQKIKSYLNNEINSSL